MGALRSLRNSSGWPVCSTKGRERIYNSKPSTEGSWAALPMARCAEIAEAGIKSGGVGAEGVGAEGVGRCCCWDPPRDALKLREATVELGQVPRRSGLDGVVT